MEKISILNNQKNKPKSKHKKQNNKKTNINKKNRI